MKLPIFGDRLKCFLKITAIAVIYYAAARLSLFLAFESTHASPVWPPSGIGFLVVYFWGYRIWPGIMLGAAVANEVVFLVNSTAFFVPAALVSSLIIGMGNAIEAVVGVYFLRRMIGSSNPLDRSQDIFKFVLVVLTACLTSSIIGPTILYLTGMIPGEILLTTWFTWWLGDVTGILILTPIFFARYRFSWVQWNFWRFAEGTLFLTLLSSVMMAVFGGLIASFTFLKYLLAYTLIPFVVWAGFKFGQAGVVLTILIVSVISIGGTVQGFGPFSREILNESLLLLQAFIGIISVTGLALTAALSEAAQTARKLKQSQDELSDFIENATEGLHWVGPDGRIIWANQAELDFLGYKRGEYVGHHIREFYVDPKTADDLLRRLFNHETVYDYEARLRCKSGDIKEVLISCNVLWEHGQFIHTRCFTRDITARKIAERNRRELSDRIASEKNKLEQVLAIEEGLVDIKNLNKLIDFVVEKTTEVLEAKCCALSFADGRSGELYLKGNKGLDPGIVKQSQLKREDPIVGYLAQKREPVLVADIEADSRFHGGNMPLYKNKSFISAPILLNRRFIGVISVAEKSSGESKVFSEVDLKILCMTVRQVAIAIESAQLHQEVKYLTTKDEATNLYNYNYFCLSVEHEIKRMKRSLRPLCLIIFELDYDFSLRRGFEQSDDEFLQKIGESIKESIREIDIACRYAKNQFAVILPDTQLSEAKLVAEKVAQKIYELPLQEKMKLNLCVLRCTDLMDRYDLIQKAGAILQKAKTKGQDIIYAYE